MPYKQDYTPEQLKQLKQLRARRRWRQRGWRPMDEKQLQLVMPWLQPSSMRRGYPMAGRTADDAAGSEEYNANSR